MNKIIYKCRVCHSKNIANITIPTKLIFFPIYLTRDRLFLNFFCKDCGALSHFPKTEASKTKYRGGSYRSRNLSTKNIQPISLPWSSITNKRSNHIYKYLKNYKKNLENFDLIKNKPITSILDYGGYNGFTSYGLASLFNLNLADIVVADLDENGLNIAKSLGMKIIDLGLQKIEDVDLSKIDCCILVHVLEHVEDPLQLISNLNKILPLNSLIYIEVPNLYGVPLCDPAHLTSFSRGSLKKLLHRAGVSNIESGFSHTPSEARLYGYPYSGYQENNYFLCLTNKNNVKINSPSALLNFKNQRLHNVSSIFYFFLKLFIANIKVSLSGVLNYLIIILNILPRLCLYFLRLILSPLSFLYFLIINLKNFIK